MASVPRFYLRTCSLIIPISIEDFLVNDNYLFIGPIVWTDVLT